MHLFHRFQKLKHHLSQDRGDLIDDVLLLCRDSPPLVAIPQDATKPAGCPEAVFVLIVPSL